MRHKPNNNYTFEICQMYFHNPTTRNFQRIKRNLRKWSRTFPQLEDYMYTGDIFDHLGYCQDRMNSGRAKSLLRLLKSNPL